MDAAIPGASTLRSPSLSVPDATSAPLAARCSAPIRLAGERITVDRKTGDIVERFASSDAPDGVVLVACGNRRTSRCPSCSATWCVQDSPATRLGVCLPSWQAIPGCLRL
jgi:hypothetical protein